MSDDAPISIDLNQHEVIAAQFIIATWDDPGTAPGLIEDDGQVHLDFPTGSAGVEQALEAAQAAATHEGGLAESARDLAALLRQVLRG
jgi:hypothetical protein